MLSVMQRQHMFHRVLQQLFGNNFIGPVRDVLEAVAEGPTIRALDIGNGNGIWLVSSQSNSSGADKHLQGSRKCLNSSRMLYSLVSTSASYLIYFVHILAQVFTQCLCLQELHLAMCISKFIIWQRNSDGETAR